MLILIRYIISNNIIVEQVELARLLDQMWQKHTICQ